MTDRATSILDRTDSYRIVLEVTSTTFSLSSGAGKAWVYLEGLELDDEGADVCLDAGSGVHGTIFTLERGPVTLIQRTTPGKK